MLNERPTDPLDVFGMFAGAPAAPPNVTLCVVWKFHVTTPPTTMSTEFGEKVRPVVASTDALAGNAFVTVITVGADATVTPPAVAETEMFEVPAATPVTNPVLEIVAFASTDELHVSVDAMALPN